METKNRWSLLGRSIRLALLLTGCLAGCATIGSGGIPTSKERTIWQTREQFVSIVPQERGTDQAVVANDHPVDIPADELNRLLASVQVVPQGASAPVPLFTETELLILKDAATSGLHQASPTEEVIFAVFGYYQALMGLAKEQKVTTGRLFYQGGKLNLILGIIHRDVMDREDRRLNPFLPGSRQKVANLGARVVPPSAEADYALKRSDWLTFTVGRDETAPAAVTPATPTPPAAPPAPQPTRQPPVAAPVTAPAPAPATAGPTKKSQKGVEERLLLLNELKSKKLITEDEYRTKRQEILNEL
ncbi:MAG TPA: hypothetical protein VIU41_09400 [Geobacteraceae bacterium]